ncbi:DUF3010 family protein [Shewanella sp. 1_MG-2023]|uniref:DUF3010 family protein n=3 Tax=Shewanella TaxID=22 RepID=UPI0026E20DEF|nr:DUF3010 family protein [Shewanella sp. 1_MG-2023]MDO6794805.1 DUF3010 family protein [Shewanella sp. 1_MG-2023]
MNVMGIMLKANEMRIVTLTGSRTCHEMVNAKFNKLALNKHPEQKDVKELVQQIMDYCNANNINKAVINRRSTTGQGAGGAGTFLLEGAILATLNCEIDFVHPATLRATDKREADHKSTKPKTVDLGKAYDLAYEALALN